jgi:hypothetical protein
MNIWKERFNPSQITPFEPKTEEFNKAWNWMFEKDENGEFIRAGLCLIVMREHSLKLRKAMGVKRSSEVAAIAVWRLYGGNGIKMPQRAF